MKSIKNIAALCVLLTTASAVTALERESIFNGEVVSHGGFGGLSLKTTSLNGETEVMAGGKGAWLINHSTYIGGAAYGTKDNLDNTNLEMGYGGLLIGHIFKPSKLVHYNIELLAGGGGLGEQYEHRKDSDEYKGDAFAFFEPGVNVSLALTKFADISLGASYRLVDGTNQDILSDSDLSGWSVNSSIVFGKF